MVMSGRDRDLRRCSGLADIGRALRDHADGFYMPIIVGSVGALPHRRAAALYSLSSAAITRSRVIGRSRIRAPTHYQSPRPSDPPVASPSPSRRQIGERVYQLDEEFRHLGETQHRMIALPIARADSDGVEPHAFLQCPTNAWMIPPSSWLIAPSGLMTSPPSAATPYIEDAHAFIDLNLGGRPRHSRPCSCIGRS